MEYIPTEEVEGSEPKLILKRMRGNSGSDKVSSKHAWLMVFCMSDHPHWCCFPQFDSSGTLSGSVSEVRTFEEREEEYEKARARIFSQTAAAAAAGSPQLPSLTSQPTDIKGIPFDLISSSPLVRT